MVKAITVASTSMMGLRLRERMMRCMVVRTVFTSVVARVMRLGVEKWSMSQLLAHNYHTRMGELDLVLREPDGTIVICEVKTRSQGMLQRPAAAVDPAKQHRLICAAQGYLQQTGQSEEPVRFDVAEVVPLDSGRWMVHIIKGAFLCET